MREQHTDCREPDGIASGLIDSLISTLRVLHRHYTDIPSEALADLAQDEDLAWLLNKMEPHTLKCGLCDTPAGFGNTCNHCRGRRSVWEA